MDKEVINHRPHERWSDQMIKTCAAAFIAEGSYRKASEVTGVSDEVIRKWAQRDNEVWVDTVTELSRIKDKEMIQAYRKGAELALEQAIKELPNASSQQAATVSAIFTDKSRLIAGQTQRITTNVDLSLEQLSQKFKELAGEYHKEQARIVSTQDGNGKEIDND